MILQHSGSRTNWSKSGWLRCRTRQSVTAQIEILMSQNRQQDIDRRKAESDYQVNVKAELEIELLYQKIDALKEQELADLARAVRDLSALLEDRRA